MTSALISAQTTELYSRRYGGFLASVASAATAELLRVVWSGGPFVRAKLMKIGMRASLLTCSLPSMELKDQISKPWRWIWPRGVYNAQRTRPSS